VVGQSAVTNREARAIHTHQRANTEEVEEGSRVEGSDAACVIAERRAYTYTLIVAHEATSRA